MDKGRAGHPATQRKKSEQMLSQVKDCGQEEEQHRQQRKEIDSEGWMVAMKTGNHLGSKICS